MNGNYGKAAGIVSIVLSAALWSGCATNLRKPDAPPMPTKVKLSTFKSVSMKTVVVDPKFAGASANEKARKKINELLVTQMKMVFPELNPIEADAKVDAKDQKVLLIEPMIEEIKFIGGAARFWVGAMAGSSAVLMKVTFIDAATGDILSAPQFYKAGNAMGGAYSMGSTDNQMLDQVVQDIAMYAKINL
ncbi:MAG: DUF4410 domain-containing protein [Lentisphaerota bacterium]